MTGTPDHRLRPCGRRATAQGDAPAVVGNGVDIRPSGLPGAGHGLFATRAFESGALVTRYEGTEISRARARELFDRDPANASHFLTMPGERWRVVAGLRGDPQLLLLNGWGGGSFANDPRGGGGRPGEPRPAANVDFVRVPAAEGLGGDAFLRVKPGMRVAAGDEILADYSAGGRGVLGLDG